MVGEERDVGARVSMTGMNPDQLAFWMLVMEAGIGLDFSSLMLALSAVKNDGSY